MENIKNLVNKIREEEILEISSWGGLSPTSGESGIIITNNKAYKFAVYDYISKGYEEEVKDFIKVIDLSNNTLEKIQKYLIDNFKDKTNSYQMIFDADFIVKINYKDINIKIKNNFKVYNKTYDDINKILGGF